VFDCLILGDSIAVGTANYRKECVSYSVGGVNTWQWNKKFVNNDLRARTVIISLGTNDHTGVNTFRELDAMRKRVEADRVYWILPACNNKFCKPRINDIIEIIARNWGDYVIKTERLQVDAIHPSWAGYQELAEKTR
jgi:hypothetical protein